MINNLFIFRNMPVKDVKSPSMNAEPVIFGETFNATLRVNMRISKKLLAHLISELWNDVTLLSTPVK